jgi:hypothetical protein
VIQAGLDEFLQNVAGALGRPRAAAEASAFIRYIGMADAGRWSPVCSDVAPGALPLEISFSQASAADLRLLIEPCLPGEGILARTAMGIEAAGAVVEHLFSSEVARRAQDLIRALLPDGEEVAQLQWRSSIWLALRTTGERSAVRVYVNAQFRDEEDRWRRLSRGLRACGFEESKAALGRARRAVSELLQPIGLCFDAGSSSVAPARVHCVTERISPYWLLRLLAATETQAAVADAADFLEVFGLLDRSGDCPILVSLGIGPEDAGSLKIDIDLPSLEPDREVRRKARYLQKAEARFGEVAGRHAISQTFDATDPRYIGLTITPERRLLNIYFPCCPATPSERPFPEPFEKARAFVHAQIQPAGLRIDARSSATVRAVPEGWPDVYMTCLLIQEHSSVLCLECQALERARSYVRGAREDWGWRYLPDLPLDLDDTAMALAALNPCDRLVDGDVIDRVFSLANADGGFRTFIGAGGESQPSHPAVTLNVAFTLDQAQVTWPSAASDAFLARWLARPDFPACEWMGSRLFPIFLFSRADGVLKRLGPAEAVRLVDCVLQLRRADGTWGGALPDSLDTALAIVTLDRLGVSVSGRDTLERFLLESQFDDGGWGWSPLYSDGSGTWFGQRAITTVFAVRAIEVLRRWVEET